MDGAEIGTAASGVPAQSDIHLNGHAMQCRVTTEDPEENFIPDYGRITAYRGATGFGVRLDGGTAYSGAVITRYYDPLLEKVTTWAPTPDEAIVDDCCEPCSLGLKKVGGRNLPGHADVIVDPLQFQSLSPAWSQLAWPSYKRPVTFCASFVNGGSRQFHAASCERAPELRSAIIWRRGWGRPSR
jgi:hypothetical protein